MIPRRRKGGHHEWLQEQLDYLPEVANLVASGRIDIYTTVEIDFETWGRPNPIGKGTDADLFHNMEIRRIPPATHRTLKWTNRDAETKQRKIVFLQDIRDERFVALNKATGGKHAADVFHLWSAEKAGLDCFLTMDRKFINAIRDQRNLLVKVDVLSPSELCGRLRKDFVRQ